MNIHQSSAVLECFNTFLKYEQYIYYHFNNLVDFINHKRMYANNARAKRDRTDQTRAANSK